VIKTRKLTTMASAMNRSLGATKAKNTVQTVHTVQTVQTCPNVTKTQGPHRGSRTSREKLNNFIKTTFLMERNLRPKFLK